MKGPLIAFQHSGRRGLMKFIAPISAWVDRGPYSHSEIVLSDGTCCTALPNRGVVMRQESLNPAHFDFLHLPASLEPRIRDWYEAHLGERYDWLGNLRFVTPTA